MIKSQNVKINNAAGFSLVELMVVVAIIGILASVAVPQFQKFTFKARLTEAKAGLTTLYTAEKAFYSEWSQYDARFGAIGYQPEGKYFFNVGFGLALAAGSTVSSNYQNSNGLAGTASPAGAAANWGDTSTLVRCPVGAVAGTTICVSTDSAAVLATTNITPAQVIAMNSAPPDFVAAASAKADLNPDGTAPNLSINQNKMLYNNVGQ